VNAATQRLGHLGIDLPAKAGQAAERCLDMAAGAAKPIIEIKVAKGGVEIVKPHQANYTATEPDAFGIPSRPVDRLGGLNEFVGLALIFLGYIGRLSRICCTRLARLIRGMRLATLGNGASDTDQEYYPGDGEVPQDRTLKLTHPSTHKFPDLLPTCERL